MSRFIVLGGPSCVGKGPLYKVLKKFYPELGNRLKQLVLYNDRAARPGEEEGVDYFFRPRSEVEELGKSVGHILAEVRGDLQALEVSQIQRIMEEGFDPFFEGNPFIPGKLREAGVFDKYPTLSVFLSPLSMEEILYLKAPERKVDLANFITDVQRLKLLHRTHRQKVNLSLKDLQNIEKRAAGAIVEMREAWKFDYVIPLHDGEGNDHWDAFYYTLGDARKALEAFASLLQGETPPGLEKWDMDLIP
jgi:guanylate kinase